MNRPKPSLPVLYPGSCEPLKAACHGLALVLAALMGAYNGAAWLRRRQSHLAVNTVIYLAAVLWEQRHVSHHLHSCVPVCESPGAEVGPPSEDKPTAAKAA